MAEFRVTFDGPALDSHAMQVRDLAPALLALGEAVTATAALMDARAKPPALAIKASGEGSFTVLLEVADASLFEKVQEFLTGDSVTAAINAKDLVAYMVIAYGGIRWLRRKRLKSVEIDLPRPGFVRVVDEAGDSIEVPATSWGAMQDLRFRQAALEATQPLSIDGVEAVRFEAHHPTLEIEPVVVRKAERDAFEVPQIAETPILDTESETVLRLINVAFQEDHKWKVSEGDATFWVQIEDVEFLDRVGRGVETFSSGDLLRVQLRHQQWSTATGPRSERAVLKVKEHLVGPRQISLPFADV